MYVLRLLKRKLAVIGILVIITACAKEIKENPEPVRENPATGLYNLPYEKPSVESISEVISRVHNFFNSQPELKIIDKETGEIITDFSVINENANINQMGNDVISVWGYPMGVTYIGMLKAYEATGDVKYRDFPVNNFDFYFEHLPYFAKIDSIHGEIRNGYRPVLHIKSLDDCGAMGASLIKVYKETKDPRFLPVIEKIADYISNKQFRLSDGTLARQRPQPQSVWGDDAYMCVPFLAQMGSLTGNAKYFDDAAKQILNMTKYLFRWDKKIYDHGVNIHNEYDPDFFWGRANGWIIMATCELLDVLPENHKDRKELLRILRTHVQGLAEYQGGDGLWHNLLDKNDTYLETSCTAMFVYGIAHAINKGWIDHTYGPVAQAGWNALTTRVKPNGEVEGTCWGTTFASDNVYYYYRPTSSKASHGYGPVLLAGAEMIELMNNEHIEIQEGFGKTYHYILKSEKENVKAH